MLMRPDEPQLCRYGGRKRPRHSSAQSGRKQDAQETGKSQALRSPHSTPIPQQEPPDNPPVLPSLSQWKLINSSLSKIKEQGTHEQGTLDPPSSPCIGDLALGIEHPTSSVPQRQVGEVGAQKLERGLQLSK